MSARILAGRYELLEKIGNGGMAVVYKARCRLLNRFVAVKILKPELTKDIKFIESFRRESQAAASLSNPNIVNIYDVGKEGNIYYIVMELIEGQTLSDIITNEGKMEYKRAVDIVKQIALALNFAHKNHIIHRDVKPHNILITKEGTAKITDFGIAKAVNTGTIVGNTGTIMGSVHYFSPEQARGGYVDEKSDIYSLGIVLYELITGRVPFDADNPVTVAIMHMNEDMIPPSHYVPDLPKSLEEIIIKATNKYQVDRYKTAKEMYDALNNIDNQAGIYSGYNSDAGRASTIIFNANNANVSKNPSPDTVDAELKEGITEDMGKNKGKVAKAKRKFRFNKLKVAAIVLALIAAIPVSHLILSVFENFGGAKEIMVPNIKGMTVEQAKSELNKLNLDLEEGDEVYSSKFDAGEIASQDPEAETLVKEGFTVTVNVSKGKGKAKTIPNVVNRTVTDAEFVLESYGYIRGNITSDYSDLPKDVVIQQSPEAGTKAAPGTVVNIIVSLGTAVEQVTMPNVMGMDIDTATTALEKAGLKIGTIGYDMSNAYAINTVMWQQYEPSVKIDKGSGVNLKISTGNHPPAGPKSIPITVDFGDAKNEVFYLTVVISDESGVKTIINREQRIKSDGSDLLSLSGEGMGTIKVLFDNDVVMEKKVNFNTGEIN